MDTVSSHLLAEYELRPDCYDEMCVVRGQARDSWSPLISQLNALGRDDLQRRWQQAERHLRDLGVTYNPLDETGQGSRPWEFNPIPLVIGQQDWRLLESGLEQRARLLQLILNDLMDNQDLIRDGFVPPDLLFGHPRFQPAYFDFPKSAKREILTFAFDVSRSPDGQWWATGDRTSSPNGLGYVLENRVVSSRMLPQLIKENNVVRLARFFATMLERIAASAPDGRTNPRIILLTEGVNSPNYFEDAYLSRYLNCTLAEGADLTIREDSVLLKTLGGLVPVDVVLRRVGDELCDPVELNPDSTIGVAGLMDATRSGHVSVTNPVGAEFVESVAWLPFLPAICRHLLSEELLLPSIRTWWCGQASELSYVLDNLEFLTIRPAFQASGSKAILPWNLSSRKKAQLVARIRQSPYLYVGQEPMQRSSVPVWCESHLEPWFVALRCFAISGPRGYTVLPGGLSRASRDRQQLENRIGAGQRSQDVWVLGDAPAEAFSLLAHPGAEITLRRGGSELPSRVADNFYWYGRNLERTDELVRVNRALLARVASDEDVDEASFRFLMSMLVEMQQVKPEINDLESSDAIEQITTHLPKWLFDETNPYSLRSSIQRIVTGASSVRDRVSMDAWQTLTELDEDSHYYVGRKRIEIADALAVLRRLTQNFAALAGLASERMTRSMGWRFLDLGKRLEGTLQVANIFRNYLGTEATDDSRILATLLEVADSVMTYRSRYRAELQLVPITDLLILDESNPRSIAFQLSELQEHVRIINQGTAKVVRSEEEKIVLSMLSAVQLADPYEMCELTSKGVRSSLDKLLIRLTTQLPRLSDAVSGRFLVHAGKPRHFGTLE